MPFKDYPMFVFTRTYTIGNRRYWSATLLYCFCYVRRKPVVWLFGKFKTVLNWSLISKNALYTYISVLLIYSAPICLFFSSNFIEKQNVIKILFNWINFRHFAEYTTFNADKWNEWKFTEHLRNHNNAQFGCVNCRCDC